MSVVAEELRDVVPRLLANTMGTCGERFTFDGEHDESAMNYFAHALPFLDRPYFMAGTSVPDWLTVVDRKVRVRSRHIEPFLGDADGQLAEVAGGSLIPTLKGYLFADSLPLLFMD